MQSEKLSLLGRELQGVLTVKEAVEPFYCCVEKREQPADGIDKFLINLAVIKLKTKVPIFFCRTDDASG